MSHHYLFFDWRPVSTQPIMDHVSDNLFEVGWNNRRAYTPQILFSRFGVDKKLLAGVESIVVRVRQSGLYIFCIRASDPIPENRLRGAALQVSGALKNRFGHVHDFSDQKDSRPRLNLAWMSVAPVRVDHEIDGAETEEGVYELLGRLVHPEVLPRLMCPKPSAAVVQIPVLLLLRKRHGRIREKAVAEFGLLRREYERRTSLKNIVPLAVFMVFVIAGSWAASYIYRFLPDEFLIPSLARDSGPLMWFFILLPAAIAVHFLIAINNQQRMIKLLSYTAGFLTYANLYSKIVSFQCDKHDSCTSQGDRLWSSESDPGFDDAITGLKFKLRMLGHTARGVIVIYGVFITISATVASQIIK